VHLGWVVFLLLAVIVILALALQLWRILRQLVVV
jgi:hypothetical protein